MPRHRCHNFSRWRFAITPLRPGGHRRILPRLLSFLLALGLTLGLTPAPGAQPLEQGSLSNQATYHYSDDHNGLTWTGHRSVLLDQALIDPLGQLLGCGGEPLTSYEGFSMALYNPLPGDSTFSELGSLLTLTPTKLPDDPNNDIPAGLAPNGENANPFYFLDQSQGTYNFLLDPSRGQLDVGRTYVMVITPPEGPDFRQRRIKLQILSHRDGHEGVVTYRATSLDGQPITATGATQIDLQSVQVNNAALGQLQLAVMTLSPTLCDPLPMQLTKTGDRAVAQPGDTVVYRLTLRNQADVALQYLMFTDTLPLGFRLVTDSVQAYIAEQPYPVQVTATATTVEFRVDEVAMLPVGEALNLVYAVQLTPDAIRGSGRNSAIATAHRSDLNYSLREGPASHHLRIDPGLLSDCGTLIGRVFEDRNFDGEQQSGEPGIANAVIFLDDGNRITTDGRGLFSLANVLPGYRSGTLDPLSIPGYALAPNRRFIEGNSASRLVHLAPGAMVRMNFGVMPTSGTGGGGDGS
jgi:uncharacterized repeat protein (TIGR01451 family)